MSFSFLHDLLSRSREVQNWQLRVRGLINGVLKFPWKAEGGGEAKAMQLLWEEKKPQTLKSIKLIEKPQKGHLFSEKAVFNIKKFWFGVARCNISELCRIY